MKPKVVILPVNPAAPTSGQLASRIRAMAGDSRRIQFGHPHFRQRLQERRLNIRQVLETLRKGRPVGAPELDDWGDWRLKLKRMVAGRRVQVVVAVKTDHMVVVTAI